MQFFKHLLLTQLLFVCVIQAQAQQSHPELLHGTITYHEEGKAIPVIGATVMWAGTNDGVISDKDGHYNIKYTAGGTLSIHFLGFKSLDIDVDAALARGEISGEVLDISMEPMAEKLESVKVTGVRKGNYIASDALGKAEVISSTGLAKMACCNLAESFENSASVTVGYSDAISGARQIRMLGLAGIYTQILDESRPIMRGLGAPYGLSYTPGMWLESIQVSKGTSSVIGGHEAISGQINLEHRKPTSGEKLFINAYYDDHRHAELNIASSLELSRKLSTVILAHASGSDHKSDMNHDGFMDMPAMMQFNLANKWLYVADNGWQLRTGFKVLRDRRRGGEMDFDQDRDRGTTFRYGSKIVNTNLNAYLKAAKAFGHEIIRAGAVDPVQSSVALVADYSYYRQDSYFGIKEYDGKQNSAFVNLLCNLYFDKNHALVLGAAATYDNHQEELVDRWTTGRNGEEWITDSATHNLDRKEKETGLFGEYSLKGRDITLTLGARADYNNHFGWFYTPRAHLKYDFPRRFVLRASAGKGFRSANLISDNTGALATGRRLVFAPDIDRLEQSLTYGGSLTKTMRVGNQDASLSFDFFRTEFENQVLADQEYNSGDIYFYSTHGTSYTNTYQGDVNFTPFTGFDLFLTCRYNDTKVTLNRPSGTPESVTKPLVDDFKALVNLQYATRYRRWVFDFTAQLNGQSRLPVQNGVLPDFEYSSVYPVFFAQVSHKFRKWDVYAGCENIGDYTQDNPIISPSEPFDSRFNSSVVWGPLRGRKFYAGFRFNLH